MSDLWRAIRTLDVPALNQQRKEYEARVGKPVAWTTYGIAATLLTPLHGVWPTVVAGVWGVSRRRNDKAPETRIRDATAMERNGTVGRDEAERIRTKALDDLVKAKGRTLRSKIEAVEALQREGSISASLGADYHLKLVERGY